MSARILFINVRKLGLSAVVCANDINNALTVVKYILLLYCLLKTNICMYNKFLNFYHIHSRMYVLNSIPR